MGALDITAELAALPTMSSAQLRQRWTDLTGSAAPKVRPGILRLALAWELQAATRGGHARAMRQHLKAVENGTPIPVNLSPGTRLVREWKGVLHMVTVGEGGVVHWNDKEWKSLSAVACAITGTHWSGPSFFGLRQPGSSA